MKSTVSSFALVSIMFLWHLQIPLGPAKLPIYLFFTPLFIVYSGLKFRQVTFSIILFLVLTILLLLQLITQKIILISVLIFSFPPTVENSPS